MCRIAVYILSEIRILQAAVGVHMRPDSGLIRFEHTQKTKQSQPLLLSQPPDAFFFTQVLQGVLGGGSASRSVAV